VKRPTQWRGQCSRRVVQREGQHSEKVLLGSGGGPGDANPPKRVPQAKVEGFGGDAMPPKGSGVSPAITTGTAKKPSLPWIKPLHIFYSKPYIHIHVLPTFYACPYERHWEWQDSNSTLGGVCSTSLNFFGTFSDKNHSNGLQHYQSTLGAWFGKSHTYLVSNFQ